MTATDFAAASIKEKKKGKKTRRNNHQFKNCIPISIIIQEWGRQWSNSITNSGSARASQYDAIWNRQHCLWSIPVRNV